MLKNFKKLFKQDSVHHVTIFRSFPCNSCIYSHVHLTGLVWVHYICNPDLDTINNSIMVSFSSLDLINNVVSVCSEHISGLYHIRITHGDAAASVPRWWYSSVLLREPELSGCPSWSQPGCGGSSSANAAKAQWLCSPAGSRLRTQYAEHTEVSVVFQGRLLDILTTVAVFEITLQSYNPRHYVNYIANYHVL